MAPATIEDARGMLWTALEYPDPVLIFETDLALQHGGRADRRTRGAVDLVHARGSPRRARRHAGHLRREPVARRSTAAEQLATTGIEAEIVDLRALRPLDDATIIGSVRRTRRAVIVDEGWRSGSLAAEIGMRIVEQGFYDLDAPIASRVQRGGADPVPEAPRGRGAAAGTERIVAAVRRTIGHDQ